MNNHLLNHMSKNVEQVLPDTDFGRELIYKMSLNLNLPISNHQIKISQIKKLRPFKDIAPNQIKKMP